MDQPLIKQQLTYMIFPFVYGKDYQSINRMKHFHEKKVKKSKVFDHVSNLISNNDDAKGKIGKAFSLHTNRRGEFGLTDHINQILSFERKEESHFITLEDIDVYLFETQIGFISIKLTIKGNENSEAPTIKEFINTSYQLKRFYYGKNTLGYENQKVDLKVLINQITKELNVQSFFEKVDKPHHALMFSSILLDKNEANQKALPTYLYEMRKSFTQNYLPSKWDLDTENNPDIFQAFENSYWGVSLEGLSNIAFLTGDKETDQFFEKSFFDNLEQTYFYLYLLVLQQKYTLLKLSIEAGSLHEHISKLTVSEQSETVNNFKERVIRFIVRGNYRQASYITHHADLYKIIRQRLGIDELLEELHNELEALSSFIDIKEDREHRKKEASTNLMIQLITLVFLPISVLSGIFGMNIPFITQHSTNLHFFYALILFYFPCVLAFLLYKERRKDR
ncbi:hypothetical protein [Neobacillus sp. D3-1R]|uniref:hypothetical protein n=1 Tax=Neobacillus sp. D3-1R TaxID=3445778 RepID=UPI003F9F3452